MRKAWKFYDPKTSETYLLPVNPLEDGGSHAISKSVKFKASASTYVSASNQLMIDAPVIQDAPNDREVFSYSGTLYTKEEYDAFMHWSEKSYPWEMTDDLGRTFLVYFTHFSPQRQRSVKFKWKHTYTIEGVVLKELGV